MKDIKVIVADIDGTLVPKYGNLSEYQISMIRKAREKGILFGIASGRSLFHCQDIAQRWGIENDVDFYISQNGCTLYDCQTKQRVDRDLLEPEWCREIIDFMTGFDFEVNTMIYIGDVSYYAFEDEMTRASREVYGYPAKMEPNLDFYCRYVEKLMFRVDEDKMPTVEKELEKCVSDKYVGFRTQPNMMEFSNRRVSKGVTLKQYCNMKNIDLKNVIAFGDTQNDEDMLKAVGVGVCMLNGDDNTKACADMITEHDCVDDGVGHFIEDHILN